MHHAHPDFIARYWGKARPEVVSGPRWHPLAFHALDVAACADVLLEDQPRILRAVARLTGLDEADARAWTLVAVALHDMGKFTPAFQVKSPEIVALADPDLKWSQPQEEDPGHAHTGAVLWDLALKEGVVQQLMAATDAVYAFRHFYTGACGHHGRPAREEINGGDAKWRAMDRASPNRNDPQTDALEFGRAVIGMLAPSGLAGAPLERDVQRASWLAAGVTNLCDWAGSDQAFFPYRRASCFVSLTAYWEMTRTQAQKAMREKGLLASEPSPSLTLEALLDLPENVSARPTPLQRWAQSAALAPLIANGAPVFAVIEDFTGSGKTEAAALLVHRIMQAGGARGLYWALPTQATSNAIHARFTKVFQRFYVENANPSIVNAHGATKLIHALVKRERDRPQNASTVSYGGIDDHSPAEAERTRWLHDDKRTALFADIGVGTIDQALLAVLPSKFNVLRLLALSKGVLVFDEAHSYDPYMNALIERLIMFQTALGGSVIVLSATLTTAQRQALAAAFAKGVGMRLDGPLDAGDHFPSAVLAAPDRSGRLQVLAKPLDGSEEEMRGTRRDLPVDRFSGPEDAEMHLLERARACECGVYIRNTVGDAQASFDRLRAAAPDLAESGKITLFHARFSMADRRRIEAETLRAFGKASTIEARAGRILVATQVVEQSLDLDFDNMVTDLAPIDLLVQRAGRLHRHADLADPYRKSERRAPRLKLVAPAPAADATANWFGSLLPVANYVYPNTGRLWAGLREIEIRGGLKLASENPRHLLDAVYTLDDSRMPEALGRVTRNQEEGADRARRGQGAANALDPDKGYGVEQGVRWEDEAKTPTRIGELGRPVRLAVMQRIGTLVPFGLNFEVRSTGAASETSPKPDWLDWAQAEIRLRRSLFADFEASNEREMLAVETLRDEWKARHDETPVVVLRRDDSNGSWFAEIRLERGGIMIQSTARYDENAGWRVDSVDPK